MESLESELARARELDESVLADAIESIGFECTRCGACCKGYEPEADASSTVEAESSDDDAGSGNNADEGMCHTDREPHTATVFPDEIRRLQSAVGDRAAGETVEDGEPTYVEGDATAAAEATAESNVDYDWRDVARPMPYGLESGENEPEGETFEWALQTTDCGDCTFYEETADGTGGCSVHADRPLICQTYPFSVDLAGTSQPMGAAVDSVALQGQRKVGEINKTALQAHECEGLGRDIAREDAVELAAALKERAVRDLTEAINVRDRYEPVSKSARAVNGGVVVHDSEGPKTIDGTPIER